MRGDGASKGGRPPFSFLFHFFGASALVTSATPAAYRSEMVVRLEPFPKGQPAAAVFLATTEISAVTVPGCQPGRYAPIIAPCVRNMVYDFGVSVASCQRPDSATRESRARASGLCVSRALNWQGYRGGGTDNTKRAVGNTHTHNGGGCVVRLDGRPKEQQGTQ
jgi:hypothetical protein